MERITSRKNEYIKSLRANCSGDYICDGLKMLEEAESAGVEITSILWKENPGEHSCPVQYVAPADLFDYASPMKNSPGPVFTVRPPEFDAKQISSAIILENVQDPGNVGTVIRTAYALGIDCVYLLGDCASLHNTKTIRASSGAIFKQRIVLNELPELPFYAAVLADDALEIGKVSLKNAAVAIGSEGHGLSDELIAKSAGKVIIPMQPGSESLNAAIAASLFMWEMKR